MVRPHYQQKKSHLAANTEIEVFFLFWPKMFCNYCFQKIVFAVFE